MMHLFEGLKEVVKDWTAPSTTSNSISEHEPEMDRLRVDLRNSEAKAKTKGRKLKEALEANDDLTAKVRRMEVEMEKLKGDVLDQRRRLREVGGRLAQRDSFIAELQRNQSGLNKRFEDTSATLDARTSELRVAQTFLLRADTVSGAEITRMLEDLNSDIFQAAAALADTFETRNGQRARGYYWDTQIAESLAGALGPTTVQALISWNDSTLVQIALQGVMTYYVQWMLGSWLPMLTPGAQAANEIYSEIYSSLQGKEVQAVAGRWRSLTQQHSRLLSDPHKTKLHLKTQICDVISNILIIGADGQGNPDQIRRLVGENFGNQLDGIVKSALQLNKVLREETTSCDMVVLWECPEGVYDHDRMDDMDLDDKKGEIGSGAVPVRLLCTTELGLRRDEVIGSESDGANLPTSTRVLLKPKVALASVLHVSQRRESNNSKPEVISNGRDAVIETR